MARRTIVVPFDDWTEKQRAALRALAVAVYPPRESADWPGRALEWANPHWGVGIFDEGDTLLSFAGVLVREGSHDGRPSRIGGVGGVRTHPDHRGRGYAAETMRRAVELFAAEHADFGLLVCEPDLIPYYQTLGWRVFSGDLLTDQPAGKTVFTFNRVMVHDVGRMAPDTGVIDLNGPPW